MNQELHKNVYHGDRPPDRQSTWQPRFAAGLLFLVKSFGGVRKCSYLCAHDEQKTGEEQAVEHPEPPTGAAGGEGEREE